MKQFTIIFLTLVSLATYASTVEAMSCDEPFANNFADGGGQIPVNANGFGWHFEIIPPYAETLLDKLLVQRLGDQGELRRVERTIEPTGVRGYHRVIPADWEEGAKYRVTVNISPDSLKYSELKRKKLNASASFVVGPEVATESLDLSVGPFVETRQIPRVQTYSDGTDMFAYRSIDVTLKRDWFHPSLFHYKTIVDGETLDTFPILHCQADDTWFRPESRRLYSSCYPFKKGQVALGFHRIQIEATLPNTDIVFRTDPEWVLFWCPIRSTLSVGGFFFMLILLAFVGRRFAKRKPDA